MDAGQLKAQLQAEAHRLGFALCGVTRPTPPPHLQVYRDWIAAGRQAGMGYLAEAQAVSRRADPASILPGCRSVIVLAMTYPRDAENVRMPAGVARYARGEDYHRYLPPRLEELARFANRLAGEEAPFRVYTDTGPILERDLAQQAGLGWIGKNTCLIHPRLGSFFFLAEIFTTLDLPADEPLTRDHCGTCTRCMRACPTGCIRPDRTLDAERCISYQTIENKGPIAVEIRAALGGRVFGCDACQTACPWNRFTPAGGAGGEPAPAGGLNDLLADLRLTPAGFNQKYRATPLTRARRRGYLRNIAAALGSPRLPEANAAAVTAAVTALVEVLRNETEPLVRGAAAWALGELAKPGAAGAPQAAVRAELQAALERESDPSARAEISAALTNSW